MKLPLRRTLVHLIFIEQREDRSVDAARNIRSHCINTFLPLIQSGKVFYKIFSNYVVRAFIIRPQKKCVKKFSQ